jgi:predicted nucleic acid-binding protein
LSGERTHSRTIERALQELVRRAKANQIDRLAGSGLRTGDLRSMRRDAPAARESGGVYRTRSVVRLVDTSAWIEVFRRGSPVTLEDLAGDRDEIVTCLPVIQEVLQGFDGDRAFDVARTAMAAWPCVESPLTTAVFDRAIDIYRRARRAGVTVRSSVDCLVAACATRHGLAVVHCDRDYGNIARAVSLEQIDISPIVRKRRS